MSAAKKIDAKSVSACPSGLDFFSVPSTQTAINKTQLKEILPLNSVNESPFDFRLFSDSQYVDLSRTYLYLKLSIEKLHNGDWISVEANDEVGFVNSIGTSFIKQMRVNISSNEVYDSGNLFPYLAYIQNTLNFSREYKRTILSTIGYYEDDVDQNAENNSGHVKRRALASEGRTFECFTPLTFDLSHQQQFLLNNLDVTFSFYQNDDRWLIKCFNVGDNNNYRIRVHSIKMFVRTVDVMPSVNMAIMRMLEREPAKYAYKKLQIRSTYLSQGRTEVTQNVFSNIVPKRLIIALIDNRAYMGDVARSPFNFKSYQLRELSINAAGSNFPHIPYNSSFDNDRDQTVMRLFAQMHETCGLGGQLTNGIDLERFLNGWCFFVIPLNSTLNECDGFSLVREGCTTVRLQFAAPLPEPVTMLCVGEFDSLLSLDRNRVVVTDGSA